MSHARLAESTYVRGHPRVLWNVLLFAATVLTTTWAGAAHVGFNLLRDPGRWTAGAPYALALLTILGVHELGHYFTARRRGIHVTLPYFIPAPSHLGTFGAFIEMRGVVRDRASYFDVAIAGPYAGLAAALLALWIGLGQPPASAHGGIVPSSSALFTMIYASRGGTAIAEPLVLGPLAFAGYLGLIVTALNLVPIGQLDGGHVAYALLGARRARSLGTAVVWILILGGLLYASNWLMWGLIAWFLAGTGHPPALDEAAPIGRWRMALGWFSIALLVATVAPWPWR